MKKLYILTVLLISFHAFSQDIFMQNGSFNRCAPDKLYDSGGPSGNYNSNENIITTICSPNAGEFIILNFTSFSTQLNQDILTIYDGPDTTAPLIGTYSGGPANSPGTVSASTSNTSGCITLKFVSNASGTTTGWAADIFCATPCQTITASIDSTNPVANGAGAIQILPGNTVDFNGSATFSNNGTGATYSWNFGNGSPVATGQSVSNTYNNPGTYTVVLTVTDTNPQGCSDTDTITVIVLGPNIIVDQTTYTVQQLIQDVLINSPCAQVSNITFSTGTNFGSVNGIGYFYGDGVGFPFQDGIIMTSGNAAQARGPNNNAMSAGGGAWPGDTDLNATVGINSRNASIIEFDFVPLASTISFDFLMASEEYDMGGFECNFSDAFAFLLTDASGTTTNLAVLPNTNTPILVTNIHPFNGPCPAINEQYFGGYTAFNQPPTSFDGRTAVFTAQSAVIPGDTYHIKLVVADATDTVLDTGVFLKAGSFNLGGELGDDITIAAGNTVCTGESIPLDTGVPTATHIWYFNGAVIPGEITSVLNVTQSGTYSVDVIFSGACQSSDSVIIEFYPDIIIDPSVRDIALCDPGVAPYNFDLTPNESLALGPLNPADFVVTYHETLADADADTNPITTAASYSGIDGQTIYLRLEFQNSGCYSTTTFNLVITPKPTTNPVPNIEICDDISNDGFGSFDLEIQTLGVLGAQAPADYVVTYHLSFADADTNVGSLISPYANISNPQPIFVRVERADDPNCYFATVNEAFNLVVNDRATATQPANMLVCDDSSNDGIGQFNLLTQTNTILGSQLPSDYTVTYFESQTDAEANSNPIPNPATYNNNISNPQTIHVRVSENATPDCYGYTTFDLIVNPLPIVISPTPLQVCDDNVPDGFTSIDLSVKNNEITGNNPIYIVSYYLTQLDADSGTNMLPIPYTNISNPQIIYVRVENINTSCYDTTTLELQVEQAPIAFVPTPLTYCDADSDGFGVFTLTDAEAQITGGAPGLTVTYHETMADAENNVNAQASPYNNIVAYMQTIYVRVESATITTDCATIVPLVLIVNDTPQIEDPTPLQVCDDNTDGFAQFNLTSKNAEVLDGLDATQYTVSYYETQADANAPANMIATPAAYTNTTAFNQTLWVRVDDTANGCYKLTTLDLIVNALPVLVQPTPLTLCDVNNPGDQMEAFTLEDANAQILNGQTGITLTYYATQADANAGTNPISSPYVNTSNAQTIYVRAVTNTTGCVSTITLDLRVNPLPSVVAPTAINECDDDNDGYASFNLESRTLQIINGEMNIAVTYHETMADANNDQNALTSPYTNIVVNTQTVFARKENTLTGCYRVIPLTLNVLPSPVIPTTIVDYVVCDTNADGFAQFNLTTKNAEILGGQNPAQFTLTYHVSQANATAGTNPIVNTTNYTNVTNPQIIYVRLVSVANGCVKTGQFEIRVELPPTAVQPTPLNLCDDEVADQMTVFDLTVKDNEITGGNGSWSVSYYTTNADAQANTNVINPATAYTNMSVNGNAANPQTLYVRVTDIDTGCTDFTTLTIRVLPNPTPSTDPSDIELCDDINTGDAQEVFDLTDNEIYIINGEVGVTPTYHTTLNDAEAGTNAIVDPTMYTNTSTPQTIYVRVTNNITGCYTIVDFDIIVNPLPAVVALTDFIICEINSDGFAQFDLDSKDAEVLNGQDATLFNVTYHATQAGADNLTGSLVSPYTNTSNPQQIFVAITNTVTGCSISTPSFNIEVQEGALANSDMDPITYIICDNIGDNDGFGQFDLTTQDPEVLDGQNPANYIVTYYTTQIDAEQGVNPIPYIYENTSNPQVIYARVDNDTPNGAGMDSSICYAVTELTLQVDLLPIFDLEDSYTLCVDVNGTEVINPPVLDTGLSTAEYTFEWSLDGIVLPGETGSSLAATQGGTYSVLVTNIATGCANTDSAEVEVSSPPTVVATVTTQAFAENHVIVAEATGDGVYEYSLDNGAWQSSGTFENVSWGEHTVTARDINGCGEASDTVIVMDYPLYFTPNGDGYHDTWNIIGIADQSNAKIYIFDRYGKLMKQLSPSGAGWNGTYNGELMPTSDYWFTVEYNEPDTGERKEFKAHFTLKR